jgi:integrase
MSVFKQGEKWWYEFTVRGKRIRRSSRVTDMELAKLIAAEHQSRVYEGTGNVSPTLEAIKGERKAACLAIPILSATPPPPITPSMTLKVAGMILLQTKVWMRRKPKTLECNRDYLWHLLQFFGDIPISEIHAGSLRDYQTERQKVVGPAAVNHETIALGEILRHAGLWEKVSGQYAPLSLPAWQKPKVFTIEEQNAIFDAANSDPDLELAAIVFAITRNTSASGSELRLAKLQALRLEHTPPTFEVTGDTTKNDIRPRLLPLNADAEDAFRRAIDRANRLGSYQPEHFIFPFRVDRCTWDPTRPTSKSWLRKQTERLRGRTGLQHLRPHAWRHQICTELLERGAPPQSVKAIMGWCSERMIETYSHTRLEAKREVIGLLSRVGANHESDIAEDVFANPAVEAEIERRVNLGLQQQLAIRPSGTAGPAGRRVVMFPNHDRAKGPGR